MKAICGNKTSHSTRWAKVFVLTAALAVALPAAGTPVARADPPPAPQKLWRQFPLDARGHSTPANKPNAGTPTAATTERRGGGTPMSAAVWAATAGAVLVALLAVAVIAGRLRIRMPSRASRRSLRRLPIRERVAELVEDPRRPAATSTKGRLRRARRVTRVPGRESEQAVLKRKGATLEAEADAKLRAKSRNGSRDYELVLLKAKQERKP